MNQTITGASIQVELAIAPKFDLTNAGPTSIQNLRIDFLSASQKFQISFSDLLNSTRVQSEYSIVLSNLETGNLIEELAVSALANGKLGATTTASLHPESKLNATLKVKRSGLLVTGGALDFQVAVNFEKQSVQSSDLVSLKDSKKISVGLVGSGLNSALVINDATAEFSDVVTTYDIYLDLKTATASKPLNMKTFSREQLKAVNMTAKMSEIIGYAQVSERALKAGQTIEVTIVAKRTGSAASALAGKSVKVEKLVQVVLK